ncbi:rhamnogalacturonan acetylesterase [Roseateles oligotrophus]|uniref:Rhamnogalacturonan acetylesterase n=1 Tax=Roseateles oligotrophus TaxID=1769250 RepID=A0ABT2YAD1_9BURK|nr:rhamnogalacturonan acetylesterase [Roseateles oligotrophus]MCV2367259.1 rhamnogalacturonan acetylesterase [Roseateles oligotrophus]
MNSKSATSIFGWLCSLLVAASAQAQAPLPAAINTDPIKTSELLLPLPANPKLPTLLLIGDSTVRNGRDDGQGKGAEGQWGWGTPIAAAFDPARVNLVNRAIGGLSSRTYLSGGHWQRSAALIKPGDTVLIQFGHNDASAINDSSRARGTLRGVGPESQEIDNLLTLQKETVYSYGAYLRRYIAEIRALGATPVILSPVPRKRWDEQGKITRSTDKGYAGWAAEVARQEQVGFIDLNALAAQRYDELGREAVMQLFPQVTPDESTHTNWAGAALNAQLVVAGLQRLKALPPTFYAAKADERPVVDAAKVAKQSARDPSLPTLHIVGDSTVRSAGQNGAYGWGERLDPFFDTRRINLVNHAIGGRSSRTFFTEGRWESVVAQLKAGDFVLIQFGHNDGGRIGDPAMKGRASAPGVGPETVTDTKPDGSQEQVHSFGWYLARYIADARAKGAAVVILSPIPHKDRWADGRDFEQFAAWGEQVAKQGGAQFIDLTLLISDAYKAVGVAKVQEFFSDARTHTNELGASFNAARLADGLGKLPGSPFEPYFSKPSTGL